MATSSCGWSPTHCTDQVGQVVAGIDDCGLRWHDLDHHHGHQSGPNNEGLARARGTTIAYLGHDDLRLPHHLATLVARLDRPGSQGATMAHATTLFVNPKERPRLWPAPGWRYDSGTPIPPTTVVDDRESRPAPWGAARSQHHRGAGSGCRPAGGSRRRGRRRRSTR